MQSRTEGLWRFGQFVNVSLCFPPSICLPNQAYGALPVLAGALKAAGHGVVCQDLNLVAADLLLETPRLRGYLERALASADAEGRRVLESSAALLEGAEDAKHLLRDPRRYFDQERFAASFWGVVDALAFVYQLDEIVSPFRDAFAAELRAHLASERWSPLRDLYAEGLLEPVLANDPELVGITVAFPEQVVEAMHLARELRRLRPDVTIAFGGPLFAVHPERWLEDQWIFDFADVLVFGDGAFSIVELVEALEGRRRFEDVRNLVWRRGGVVVHNDPQPWLEPLDELPLPDFASLEMERFFTPQPIYPLMLSRGCYWGRCTFCSLGWRENFRMLGTDSIERHARHLSRLGARYVQLQDSSIPPAGAQRLARVVRDEGLGLYWEGGFKFSEKLLDPQFCAELHAGGCRSLKLGLESMNQGVIDLMDKGFQVERVPTMLHNLRDAGISAELLWFLGFPTEEIEDVLRTVRFLHERRELFGLTAFVGDYALHPDTIVFDRPADFGVSVTGQQNGYCTYTVERGLQQDETLALKQILSCHNNRTLVCNGSHLPHLVEGGMDLSGLARPPVLPEELARIAALASG